MISQSSTRSKICNRIIFGGVQYCYSAKLLHSGNERLRGSFSILNSSGILHRTTPLTQEGWHGREAALKHCLYNLASTQRCFVVYKSDFYSSLCSLYSLLSMLQNILWYSATAYRIGGISRQRCCHVL